jgi:predicted DNA-binding transcriptional regulator YafY
VKAALRKLVRALPEPLRERALAASDAVLVEPTTWDRTAEVAPRPPLLDRVQQAVVDRERLRVCYRDRTGAESERELDPLGVVAKGRTWYVLTDTAAGRRTLRIDRITSLETTGERAVRPPDFDLAAEWSAVRERVDDLRTPLRASGTVDRQLLGYLVGIMGTRLAVGTESDDRAGHVHVELRGHGIEAMAAEIAGFGSGLVVDEPAALRDRLALIGRELAGLYDAP